MSGGVRTCPACKSDVGEGLACVRTSACIELAVPRFEAALNALGLLARKPWEQTWSVHIPRADDLESVQVLSAGHSVFMAAGLVAWNRRAFEAEEKVRKLELAVSERRT